MKSVSYTADEMVVLMADGWACEMVDPMDDNWELLMAVSSDLAWADN